MSARDDDSAAISQSSSSGSASASRCTLSQTMVSASCKTEVSSFNMNSAGSTFSASTVGSGSIDDLSLDSIGRMLLQLEDNDSSLRELVVDCKTMDFEAARLMSQYLPNNTRLSKLTLRCGKRSRQIFLTVFSGLKGKSSVRDIEIEEAFIDRGAANVLVPFFGESRTLESFSMKHCKGPGLAQLFVAMQHNKHIKKLSFHACHWESHNADIVASSLPLMDLYSLSLVDVSMHVDGIPYLFKNIERCVELTELDLSKNEIDASSIRLLTKCLAVQRRISKLTLSSCDLDDSCIMELAKGLRKCKEITGLETSLTSLDISCNTRISDKGVIFLKDLLSLDNSITDLDVSGCELQTESIEVIGRCLRYNNSCLKHFVSEKIFGILETVISSTAEKHHQSATQRDEREQVPSILDERDVDETIGNRTSDERASAEDDETSVLTEVNAV